MPPESATDVYADRDAAPEMDAEEVETKDTKDDAPDKKEGDDDDNDKSSESATGLLSKSFFGDKSLEPGTTCKVKIEKVYDDQVSISYVPHGSKDKDSDDDDDKPKESDDDIYD